MRYPGSKSKIWEQIFAHFPEDFENRNADRAVRGLFQPIGVEYREPFFGSGAVGMRFLEAMPRTWRVWLNEKDYWLYCLWLSVRDNPKELTLAIRGLSPSPANFYAFKEQDGDRTVDPVVAGARKLALHQWSFSGLGAMAGGPIGGRTQSSQYNVGCRWNKAHIERDIHENNRILRRFAPRVNITCGDFASLIDGAPDNAFIYADPPYYEKGPQLYKYAMSLDDHRRLAASLRRRPERWVLSYDDHDEIRRLYGGWASFHPIDITYTTAIAQNGKRRKNREIVIKPVGGQP